MPEELLDKERGVGQTQRDNFRKAHAAGVKMAFGTDAGVYPHGDNAKQFHYMVMYGMTPAEAIQAATTSAADLHGRCRMWAAHPRPLRRPYRAWHRSAAAYRGPGTSSTWWSKAAASLRENSSIPHRAA